uniref:Uncharacterized protein n=1 Tax=Cantharellus cibarius TaxID=36066 RepID=A0A2S0S486_CANCI|nr:hypothetical protein [Cantharellus cibarius]
MSLTLGGWKTFIDKLSQFSGGALTALSVESYLRGLKKDLKDEPNLRDLIETHKQITETIRELMDDKIENSVMQGAVTQAAESSRKSMEDIQSNLDKARKLSEQVVSDNVSSEDKANITQDLSNVHEVLKSKMQTLNTEISSMIDNLKSSKGSGSSSFTDWSNIYDLYINVQNYIDLLSLDQKAALANIGLLFSILISTISITGILVGDRIVEYFKLEQRFPWAARYFELRRKFRYYYSVWNILLILIMTLLLLSFNIFVLFKDILMS